MKLKYVGKEKINLRKLNSMMKIKPGQIINVTAREMERFKDRDDFKKVKDNGMDRKKL